MFYNILFNPYLIMIWFSSELYVESQDLKQWKNNQLNRMIQIWRKKGAPVLTLFSHCPLVSNNLILIELLLSTRLSDLWPRDLCIFIDSVCNMFVNSQHKFRVPTTIWIRFDPHRGTHKDLFSERKKIGFKIFFF